MCIEAFTLPRNNNEYLSHPPPPIMIRPLQLSTHITCIGNLHLLTFVPDNWPINYMY